MRRLLPAYATGAASGAPLSLGDLALQLPHLTRRLTALHGALFLRRQNGPLARWFGASILVLETLGRRTGRLRATPLAYLSHGDNLVVVPANAGADLAPAWWLNLQAAGQGVAILGNVRRPVRPRVAADTEHQQLWQRVATVAPIDHYQRRTRRPLPIVVLEPTGTARAGRSATRAPSTASLPAQASAFAGLERSPHAKSVPSARFHR